MAKKKYHVSQIAHNVPSSANGPHTQYRDGFQTLEQAEQYIEFCSGLRITKRTRHDFDDLKPRWYLSHRGEDLASAYLCTCERIHGCACDDA